VFLQCHECNIVFSDTSLDFSELEVIGHNAMYVTVYLILTYVFKVLGYAGHLDFVSFSNKNCPTVLSPAPFTF